MFFEHYWQLIAVSITLAGLLFLFALVKIKRLGRFVDRMVTGINAALWQPFMGRLWQSCENRMRENWYRKLEASLDRRRVEALSDAMISEQSRRRKGDL